MMQELSEMKNVQKKSRKKSMNRMPACFLCLQMTLRVEGGKFTRKSKLENQKRNKRRIRRFSKRNKSIAKDR